MVWTLLNRHRFSFLYLFLIALYGAVGYGSLGYDDEFRNIRLVETLGIRAAIYTQSVDVHPPGSYLMNWLLFSILGRWELVRLAISMIMASSLIYAISSIRNRHGERAAAILFLLLGLNPAFLLWCTGLRWYAFFVPLLIWLSIVPEDGGWHYWGKCFGGLLCLGYVGYAMFIVTVPVLVLYWSASKEQNKTKARNIVTLGSIFCLLYLYQLTVFLSVHVKNRDGQILPLIKNLYGFYVAHISNQGVFPLSPPGLVAGSATIGLIIVAIAFNTQEGTKNRYLVSYFSGGALAIATGLAGKFRNLVILSPWQALWISTAGTRATNSGIFVFFLCFVSIGNICGIINVATHRNTTKNSWNLPIGLVMDQLAREKAQCGNDLIVLCHDPALSWHINKAGYQQMGPYAQGSLPKEVPLSRHKCVILIKTFAGTIGQRHYKTMLDQVALLRYARLNRVSIGRDDYFRLKSMQDTRYPEYMIDLTAFHDVEDLTVLESWQSPGRATRLSR